VQLHKNATDVAIIGAGPYGLSIAAHLGNLGVPFRIFGTAMHSWRNRMPAGMCLKSEGFASNLYEPRGSFTLGAYSSERGLPYLDVGYPVPLETFVQYGLEFQRRFVPTLEETDVTSLTKGRGVFVLHTADGQTLSAKRVAVAVGITHFSFVPPALSTLGPDYVTHSSEHRDPARLRGRSVVIVGAGASAVDLAGLMYEAGVDVSLIARREAIDFHLRSSEPRPWLQRLSNPRSGLGIGWRSRLCTDAPLLFHAMPLRLRLRAVRTHLGPAAGWFVKDKVVGRVPTHLGAELKAIAVRDNRVHLTYRKKYDGEATLVADHVIAGTGYRVAMQRLSFLHEDLRRSLKCVEDSPVLKTNFEASVPGLHFVGLASANSFGPLTRFAYGAGFTARRLSRSWR
jgi:cation diffusion facilitator CzcD-associated flavoprotein CzcO